MLGRADHGGTPEVIDPAPNSAERMLTAPNVDTPHPAQVQLRPPSSTRSARWCCFDMHRPTHPGGTYARAQTLTKDAGNVITMVSAAQHLPVDHRKAGASDDALKLYQMAQIKLD